MAKTTVKLVHVKKGMAAAKKAAPGAATGTSFILLDDQNDSLTVQGVDAAGNPVDISGVATLSISSDTPTVLTVGAPTGMTATMTAVGPTGSANVTAVATWNDGSLGPFSFTLPVSVNADPSQVGGVVIVPGTPVAN